MNVDLAFLDNDNVAVVLAILIGLYGLNLGRIELPDYIKNLFKNNIFRVVFLSLLLIYNFDRAPHVALVIALVFVITMNQLNQQEAQENFALLEAFRSKLRK